ncbi:MAG: Crp/Fnr family transcriptional regulator [Gammaproteobacteria bacterium]|nr:Crp/Fnr family transcriptional regulator [Gammaproteobacteria bacterium]
MGPRRTCAQIGCKIKECIDAGELSPSALGLLQNAQETHTYRRGDTIFVQGEVPTGIYCLRSGNALLTHVDAFKHKTGFRVVSQGEIIGYRSMFGEDTHAATAQALATTDICFYPKEAIVATIDTHSGFARRFLRTLARDRGPPDGLLLRGQHLPVRVRLMHLLSVLKDNFSETADDGMLTFQLPLTRRDIASMLAARPESITRAIAELKRENVVIFSGRQVKVPDPERLYVLSGQSG